MQTSAYINRAISFEAGHSARRFTIAAVAVAVIAAMIAGLAPLQMSVAVVFLFAGPHNWIELRYFLSRMPVKWAASRNFFLLAIAGVVSLTVLYLAAPLLAGAWGWNDAAWSVYSGAWSTVLILWIAALVYERGRAVARRNWSFAVPVGLATAGLLWLAPGALPLALVYIHPMVALWFLDRQIMRSRPEWRAAYRASLACVPLLVAMLGFALATAPPLAEDNGLALRITQHAGADIFVGVSTHFLVAVHVFLETLHYGVWLVALPLIGMKTAPWQTGSIPLVRHRLGWPRTVRVILAFGAFLVLLLWACFVFDYSTTRDIYFTVAMIHVLAEAPFLVRLL
jgi:hypothetical protein